MSAVMVEPDHRLGMDSFQYRTFRCVSCGDTERCFAFDPKPRDQPTMPGPAASASIVPGHPAEGGIQSRMARIADALSVWQGSLTNERDCVTNTPRSKQRCFKPNRLRCHILDWWLLRALRLGRPEAGSSGGVELRPSVGSRSLLGLK